MNTYSVELIQQQPEDHATVYEIEAESYTIDQGIALFYAHKNEVYSLIASVPAHAAIIYAVKQNK